MWYLTLQQTKNRPFFFIISSSTITIHDYHNPYASSIIHHILVLERTYMENREWKIFEIIQESKKRKESLKVKKKGEKKEKMIWAWKRRKFERKKKRKKFEKKKGEERENELSLDITFCNQKKSLFSWRVLVSIITSSFLSFHYHHSSILADLLFVGRLR